MSESLFERYRGFVPESLFDDAYGAADRIATEALEVEHRAKNANEALRDLVRLYGERGLLRFAAPEGELSIRAICLIRERLAHASPLAELAFAMQGLGSFPIAHAGGASTEPFVERVRNGQAVAAFALTEAGAGSDLSGIRTSATRDGDGYVLNGEKIYISNAGIADGYALFARTGGEEASASRRLSAFFVPADAKGHRTSPIEVLGGHPIGRVHLENVHVPASSLLGEEGRGLGLALATLGRFRTTVGAAALGFAQRALDESVQHTQRRTQFGGPLSALPQVQGHLGDMACLVEGARLLVYRAARNIDEGAPRHINTRTGSMAKLVATENAQRVIDAAVQLHGALGVTIGTPVARLYEEVRALRIYEGTSDVQRTLIARELLARP